MLSERQQLPLVLGDSQTEVRLSYQVPSIILHSTSGIRWEKYLKIGYNRFLPFFFKINISQISSVQFCLCKAYDAEKIKSSKLVR